MGRLTEMIDFITRDTIPTASQRDHLYSGISNFEELKKARKEHRKQMKEKGTNEVD